jgi:membrane-associated phospholipid phosphatase
MADIFISYAKEDIEHARALDNILTTHGWTVFWDRDLLPGPNFREVLAEELNRARCVIVLWSRLSVKSNWVIDEADQGLREGRLVSVLLDDILPPLGFRQGQAAQLWDGKSRTLEIDQLLKGVAAVIAQSTEQPPSPEPSPHPESPGPVEMPPEPAPPRTAITLTGSFLSRHPAIMPALLLLLVFGVNYIQTATDEITTLEHLGAAGGYPFAEAFSWSESYLSFESHDMSNPIAYIGYSISYFFLFPLMAVAITIVLANQQNPSSFRTFSLAVAINYLLSLPFYLFLPVPERWAYPDSEAILLSDLWNESLITLIRPISGLDNCFPSFHTSLTVTMIAVCYLYNVRLKTSVLFIGASIVFATFTLGIHWIPDIIAGTFLGLLSVALAKRLVDGVKSDFLWG